MPKEDKQKATLEAIPAAGFYKEYMVLGALDSCQVTLSGLLNRRSRRGRLTVRDLADFQSNVVFLYERLRVKFKKTHKVHNLKNFIRYGTNFTFKELYDFYCILWDKIESMKITKIERLVPPADETF